MWVLFGTWTRCCKSEKKDGESCGIDAKNLWAICLYRRKLGGRKILDVNWALELLGTVGFKPHLCIEM